MAVGANKGASHLFKIVIRPKKKDRLRPPRFTEAQVLHTEGVEYLRGREAEEAEIEIKSQEGFGTRQEQNSMTEGRLDGG